MDFQQTWREQIQERLAGFAASARAQFQQAAPDLLYGFLSAMALWPVAEAVQRGDLAALVALGSVAGGVGANLIANQVQNWKDEADAAEQLSQAAQSDPDMRKVLDVLLDKLKVVEQAQAGMSEADRAWLLETLRREMAQLGSSLTVVTVAGSATAAVGEQATAAGAEGMAVGHDLRGNVSIVHYHGVEKTDITTPTRPRVYHNLPQPDYVTFVGREQERNKIHELLLPYPRSRYHIITIDGIGGIGKSALALEVAQRYLRQFTELPEAESFQAIIWISAKAAALTANGNVPRERITRTLDDIYTTISVVLEQDNIARAHIRERGTLISRILTQQRTLLILDNLETVDDAQVMSFLMELPAPTKCIVTTRRRIDVAYPIRLTEMSDKEALALIAQESEKKNVTLTKGQADLLYRRTGGVPLAIVWSIAQMAYGYSVETVLRRLGDAQGEIANYCFQGAMGQIRGQPAHILLMALSLFETDASRELLGYVVDLPDLDCDDGLVELEKLSLVNRDRGRFNLLPLTRLLAHDELLRHPKGDSLRRRYLGAVNLTQIEVSGMRRYVQVTAPPQMVDTGEAATRVVHGDVFIGPPPQDNDEALAIYRQVLVQISRHLPLRGVDLGASDSTDSQQRFHLARVYVDLDTKTHVLFTDEEKKWQEQRIPFEEHETRPLGILEATISNRRLVILGDPGAGKSTFLSHLALCLAAHALQPDAGWLDRLSSWPRTESDILPIVVRLRDFWEWLATTPPQQAEAGHLWYFMAHRLDTQNLALATEPIRYSLEQGRALVLLDGLDEVPSLSQRLLVCDVLKAFVRRYPDNRYIVTCRTLSYQDPAWQLEGFPAFELAPFAEEKIDRFIGAWYDDLARLGIVKTEEAGRLARQLQEAVRRPDLWRLAPNPLLLTVMALVHTHKGRLPDARALLYEDTVDVLLWRWEQIKAGGEEAAPRLRRLLLDAGRTDVDLKRALWRLAFEAHREGEAGGEALADVGELRLEKALAGLHPEGSRDWAHQVIEAIKLRAGLLLERAPEVYTFPHRTFQEYLAGAHLSAQADFARQAVGLVEEGAFWREVVLLAVGRLVYLGGDVDKPLALVGELCPQQMVDDEVAWRKAWLAGEVLVEMGLKRVQDSALGRDLAERVRQRLADLIGKGYLSPVERAVAGDTLARLGDPRPGVGLRPDGLPDVLWCEVPAGPFLMGSDKAMDPRASDDELPQHEVTLPAYFISKYPATNAQYIAFVAAGGYQERRYWTEAGWRWKEDRIGLGTYGGVFDLPNHPVVGVSWYEAMAFCRWLTERLRGTGEIGPDQEVMLPTEAQWEKAARGEDGRIFPWGYEFDLVKGNVDGTGIGTTSAVGIFPVGASPYGVQDMSGNVWEWCRTKWRDSYREMADDSLEGETHRVLRGGAFYTDEWFVRCASRVRSYSDFVGLSGFRIVVALSSSLDSGISEQHRKVPRSEQREEIETQLGPDQVDGEHRESEDE